MNEYGWWYKLGNLAWATVRTSARCNPGAGVIRLEIYLGSGPCIINPRENYADVTQNSLGPQFVKCITITSVFPFKGHFPFPNKPKLAGGKPKLTFKFSDGKPIYFMQIWPIIEQPNILEENQISCLGFPPDNPLFSPSVNQWSLIDLFWSGECTNT